MRHPHTIPHLSELISTLSEAGQLVDSSGQFENIEVTGVTDDSRRVEPGSMFVAVEGLAVDGHRFAATAVDAGARVVVCSKDLGSLTASDDLAVIRVRDSRVALGLLSHTFQGRPSAHLRLTGVTGTNGKTTTTWLVHHMLTKLGRETGLLGTIETRIGTRAATASMTTPAAPDLNAMLAEMVDAGCTDAVMEVSSHAIAQERIAGLDYAVAVFTNLTRDHLDFHGTWSNYLATKKRLFTSLPSEATAIVNADDDSASKVVDSTKAHRVSFGRTGHPTHRFKIASNDTSGLSLAIDGDTRRYRLAGTFNAYNLTAAYSVGRSLGFERTETLDALETAEPVPGRLERFTFDSGVTVFVDYAHTPDALKNALRAIKDTAPAQTTLWCIFGCGGDRDPGKRPEMGSIAEAVADRVVVTSDNPRKEAPEAILDDIRDGMERPERAEWIVDRREAIQFVGRSAASGDIVLVAGKGHEPYQVIGTDRVHFDDRMEVRQWFG